MPSSKGIFSFGVSFRLTIEPLTRNTRDILLMKVWLTMEKMNKTNTRWRVKEAIEQKTENEMSFKLLLSTGKGRDIWVNPEINAIM